MPTNDNARAFVDQVYQNILNRAPDAAGEAFWINQLTSGSTKPGSFIATLEASVNMQSGTPDALTLSNKVIVGEDYVSRIVSANVAPSGAAAVLAPVTSDPATVGYAKEITSTIISIGPGVSVDVSAGFQRGGSGSGPVLQNDDATAVNKVAVFADFNGFGVYSKGYDTVFLVSPVNIGTSPTGGTDIEAIPGQSLIVNLVGNEGIQITNGVALSGVTTTINVSTAGSTSIFYTNAQFIDATSSGGLQMGGPGYGAGANSGQTITGSAAHPNSIVGSPGNDTITASFVGGDAITTAGGADTIQLNNHTQGDTILLSGFTISAVLRSFSFVYAGSIVDANDFAQPGFWGIAPSAVGQTSVPLASTSADQSFVKNFNPSIDSLQFVSAAWKGDPNFTASVGLSTGDGHSIVNDVTSLQVVMPTSTMLATANVIEINGATFANASALATALSSSYSLNFASGGVAAGHNAHMLFLYNDTSGNAHIADVDFQNQANSAAATSTTSISHIVASDMVELVGVSATNITANNIHLG